jgi:cell division control protein 6
MFISGPPGTGKTALVTRIVRELATDHPGDVRVISINCMALKTLDTLWERMIDELDLDLFQGGKKTKGREAVQALLQTTKLKW